jgi:tetratricopeptide (TPR) repeat protein
LIAAADVAFQRYDVHASTTLLDEAISLADSGGARVMRARIRLSTGDFPAARVDALRALELGSGAPALELAGWVSYYARDYDAARRYADEGVERSTDQGIKASCLALAGRIRHARGELLEAEDRLERAVVLATPQVRGVAQVWHSSLLVHVGRTDEAIEVARRGLLEPVRSHPFAALAGRFALAHALGLTGRWADALDVLDDLDAEASRMGETGKRFPPVAANVRGWLLRAVGALDRAVELHERASATPLAPEFREPYYAALLDLTEDWLAAGDLDRAALALDRARQIRSWEGTMSWRHRMRLDLVDARFRLASGDVAGAEQLAHVVVQRAGELHQPRYLTRAVLLRDVARARRGVPVAAVALDRAVEDARRHGGPEAWSDLAQLAAATRSDAIWRTAEDAAASLLAQLGVRRDVDADRCGHWLRAQLERQRR